MTTTNPRPQNAPGEHSFEAAIANQMGVIRSNLETLLDRNPDAPRELRAALARLSGKCMPLADLAHLKRLRSAYEDEPVAVEVFFTEATAARVAR
jgi:hypothetical protein